MPEKKQPPSPQESKTIEQPNGLIEVLFDKRADIGDRDDAAMDLQMYHQDDRALMALTELASHPDEEEKELLIDVCGESIAEIFVQQKNVRKDILCALDPTARWYAINYIKACKPEWMEEYDLEKLLE